ncbi:MAG: ABC transporter substrate-binding protein [Leptolyngbyaceae bacterium]|nr:ABC transporter substrate-binding protein [Leptolyngbyaceae bacterium]
MDSGIYTFTKSTSGRHWRHWHWHKLLLGIAVLGVSACDSLANSAPLEETGDRPNRPNELVWARPHDVDVLHPHRTTDIFSWQIMDQLYDTLLAFDEDGTIVPNLAKEWQISEDGLTVNFLLHDDIQCHDGTAFDAEDVRYTVEHALRTEKPSETVTNWGGITQFTVVNAHQVQFQFSEPFAPFIPFMADPFASMLCDSTEVAEADDELQVAVGTGPWTVERWTPGKELVLEPNPTYVNRGRPVENPGAPYLDRLIIETVPEAFSRVSNLRWNDADLITDPPIDEMESLRQNRDIALHLADNTGQSIFFQFTAKRPPFNDLRARQAIAYALHPEEAILETFDGLAKREHCPVADGVVGNDPDWCAETGYSYDPERAIALLAELGYGPDNPLEVNLISWSGDRREKVLSIFQQQLAEVGVKATLNLMDISTLNARVQLDNAKETGPGTIDLMGWSWYDADILHALWHSPGAYGGYQSPELDALLRATQATADPDVRLQRIQAVQAYLLEQAVVIPIYTPGWLWIYASKAELEGLKIGPFNRPLFNDVRWNQ